MKPTSFETLIADQRERIERCNLKAGDNAILDYINDLNSETNGETYNTAQ